NAADGSNQNLGCCRCFNFELSRCAGDLAFAITALESGLPPSQVRNIATTRVFIDQNAKSVRYKSATTPQLPNTTTPQHHIIATIRLLAWLLASSKTRDTKHVSTEI